MVEGKQDAVRLVLRDQEQAGIDIVSDGEQTRQHFVTTFIEHLEGVDFQRRETIRIRDRYDANVPIVAGQVSRPKPIYVDDARFQRLFRRSSQLGRKGPGTFCRGADLQNRGSYLLWLRHPGKYELEKDARFGMAAV